MRTTALVLASFVALGATTAAAAPKKKKRPAPAKAEAKTPEQKEADRHFKSGVALFKEAKFTEALAEFERAYEIAPHPLVLYNIAGCHRELSHYSEAVTYYTRFLADGKDVVPAARLAAAQTELDGILARIARVTVTISPELPGTTFSVDGAVLERPAMPLILPPGEHRLLARAEGHRDADKTVRLASGDELTVALVLGEIPPAWVDKPVLGAATPTFDEPPPRRLAVSVGFGTNLRRASQADSGAPALGLAVAVLPRLELAAEVLYPALAVVPAVRVRVLGERLALHVVGALPIAIKDGDMSETFVAGGIGAGLRFRPTPRVAFLLESYAAFAGAPHGTTVPTFLRGELWF